ncbi:MAG: phytanoyl-CoA dioxygenase family protein [Caulobacter sp.]|nr:phytanoyl-CoA dioxygenase family protein [Caulobacter sp.]
MSPQAILRKPDASPPLVVRRGLMPAALIAEAVDTLREMLCPEGPGEADLDTLVDRLRARDRSGLGAVYDAFRETLIFQRLIAAPALVEAAQGLVGAARLHAPFQHAVFRMDLAGEAWRGFQWHQDAPYNVLSDAYVTAWLPLTDSGVANGSIQAAPALSDRLWPVDIRYKRDAEGRRLSTRDAFIAEALQPRFETAAETLELGAGDVALFHNRLVHRSGFNPGPRHRYSVQVRFGDLMAPEMLARGWRNRRVDGFETFKTLYPDLIASEETP